MATRYVRDEELIAEAIKSTRRGVRDVQRPTGTERAQTMVVAQDALDRVEVIEQERGDEDVEALLVPMQAAGLAVASNVGVFTIAGPVATVSLTWSAVSLSTGGGPISIAEYEVWNAAGPVTRVPAIAATLTLASGQAASFRVRALSSYGVWGDLSDVLEVTGAAPEVAVRAPSTPELSAGAGNAFARWDGTYVGGGTIGAHTVVVEARIGAGAWIVQGAALTGAGSQLVRLGAIGDVLEVRLVAYDQSGRETGTSDTATVTVAGIDGADITVDTLNGNRILAGTLLVDSLEPNYGSKLNIWASEAVEIIVGRQDEQDAAIEGAQQAADSADGRAQTAQDGVAQAKAAAAIADGKALVADTKAQATQDQLAIQRAVFRVTEPGAEVASRDGANVFAMTSAGAQIIQGGTVASYWDGTQFVSNEIVTNRAVIANHVIEASGAGTVFRAK